MEYGGAAMCDAVNLDHRLVAEISTARMVERALYARRLLLSGRQVPEVYATEVAREHADISIAELDKEIENLLFETRVRKEVVSDTLMGKGYADSRGIHCWNSSPQIQGGVVDTFECGINFCGGNPTITGVQVSNNSLYLSSLSRSASSVRLCSVISVIIALNPVILLLY